MATPFDDQWAEEVSACCDPVFDAADVGFVRQVHHEDERRRAVVSLLWEADPTQFAERYPDSGIIESYGEDQWPDVPCIDYWVYVDHQHRKCQISVEGWGLLDLTIALRGRGDVDGPAIAQAFARILRVPAP